MKEMHKPGCDQCNVLSIQGVACHEQGCPNHDINPVTGEYYDKECRSCGCLFTPEERGQAYCDQQCQEAMYGF